MNFLNGSISVTDLQIRSTNLQNYRILSHIFIWYQCIQYFASLSKKKKLLHDLYLCTISDLEAYEANYFFN